MAHRTLSRRDMLKLLGLSTSGAVLVACGAAPSGTTGAATSEAAASTAAAGSAPAASEAAAASTAEQTSLYDPAEGADAEWPTSAVADPAEKVEISVAHAWDATFFERQKQFDQLFTERHPNITVNAENTPWGEFRQKYLAQAAGGALPDLFYIHFSWAQDLIKNNTVQALDEYVAGEANFNLDDFIKPSLVSYQRDGKLWVIPYDEGPGILYYNKDIFDKAGVEYPDDNWTLDDLKANAVKLTSGEGQDRIFGLGGTPSPGDSAMAPSYVVPFGGQYLAEPKEDQYLLNKPEGVKAMEWWMELRSKDNAVPSPAEAQAFQQANINAFQVGRVAMMLDGSWATPGISQNAKFKWDVAKWPEGPEKHSTFSAGSGYGIASTSKNPDAAWIYLNDYLSTAGQSYMWGITGRGSPARNSAWESYLKSEVRTGQRQDDPGLAQRASPATISLTSRRRRA